MKCVWEGGKLIIRLCRCTIFISWFFC